MKKKTVVWLSILLAIIVLLGIFAYTQRNNISAIIDSFKYSNEEIEEKLSQDKSKIENFLKEENDISIRELTEEESKALSEGKITEDEIIDIIVGNGESPSPEPSKAPQQKPNIKPSVKPEEPTPTPDEKELAKKKVAELIAKLYVQKSKYLGKLDDIEAYVRSAYLDMPYKEQKGAKQKFLAQYLPEVASWEKECDAIVGGIISEIREALKESGQDSSIADTLEAAYKNEKKSKKAYFINRYMD